jgi:hypothetical protein
LEIRSLGVRRLSPRVASLVLSRHLEAYSPTGARLRTGSLPTQLRSCKKRPLASLACPSACPNLRARFPWNFSKSHLEPCAQDSIVPPSGFGYPLGDVSSASPRKPLSASHTPGLRLFRAFLDRMIELRSPSIPSALTLPFKTSPGLEDALQRLHPTSIAGFFLRPEFFPRIGKPLLS